jgi:tetratricopeptide (TPR) repeat protein
VVAPRESGLAADGALPSFEGLVTERVLGRGGFGEVYLARRASDGLRVAVKVPHSDADAIMRLRLEGETLRDLGGVHAPALFAAPTLADGRPYLVMEFVPLPTLADRLSELENGMPIEEVARRGRSILDALAAVHALNLVHRDLKPENIFSSDLPPVTRVFDFGLVKTPAEELQSETTAGTFMGTPEYMAPEQLDSSAPVDRRADIYAVGAVLYEMLTGRPPFWGNAAEVKQALANRRVPRPSRYVGHAPPALEEVVIRCLAKDPARRYASTEELAAAFEAALSQPFEVSAATSPEPAAAPAPEAKPQQAAGKRPMAAIAVRGIGVDLLKKALASAGGHLAEIGQKGGVGLFGEKTSENPVRRAVRLADSLIARKACASVIVDLAQVTVRRKPDGGERYVSAVFARLQKQLEALGRDGLFLTAAAGELMPERRGEPLAEGLVAALPPPREDDALTVVRSAQAPLVGRGDEMEALLASARGCIVGGRPGLATVIADGGLGKSHLCATLLEELRAAAPAGTFVELRVREPIDGEADGNLRALLGRCFTLPVEKPADRGKALLAELGPTLWAVAALALGWMTPDEPELRSLGAAPGVLRAMVSRSVGEALRLRARERPFVLILDDAHFADDATLEAIEYATMADADAPLWVCVAARPALAQMKPSWGERAAAHLLLELPPLATDVITQLARQLLYPVENVPDIALEALVAGTYGNPFLLSELVRALKRDGIVRLDPKSDRWFLAADEMVRLPDIAATDWLAEREIGALPAELATHARMSALLGVDFSEDEMDGILSEIERAKSAAGAADADVDHYLDPHVATRQLLTMGVFKRQRNGRATFRHALLRAAVEKSVSDRVRSDVHAAAFRYYRGAAGLDDSVRLPRLALHAAAAGYRDEAAPLYLALADRARLRHAYVEAESLYSRSLSQMTEGRLRDRMLALRGRGLMRYRMSRADAVDDLMAAIAAARELGDRAVEIEIVLEAATAFDWMNEYHKSRELVSEAEALLGTFAADAQPELLRASLLVGQGRAVYRFSDEKGAIVKLREGTAMAEKLGDAGYEIRVISLLLLGALLPFHGQMQEAERAYEALVSLAEEHGDRMHLTATYTNRRVYWLGRRDLARALEDTKRSIQLAMELGLVVSAFIGEYNLGELLYQAGDPDAAWPHVRRAVDLEKRKLSGFKRPVAKLLEARLLTFLGRDADARAVFESITAGQVAAEKASDVDSLLVPSERVLLTLVDLCTRAATDQEWQDLHALAKTSSVEQELIEVAELTALAFHRRGLGDAARRAFAETMAFASTIPNVMEKRLQQDAARLQADAPLAQVG